MLIGGVTKNPGRKHTRLPTGRAKPQAASVARSSPCVSLSRSHTQTHTVCSQSSKPQCGDAAATSRHAAEPNKTLIKPGECSLTPPSLPACTTLSEAGVEQLGPVGLQAVPDWLQAQVDDLVEAELAAVNGRGFGLQGDEELLGTFG